MSSDIVKEKTCGISITTQAIFWRLPGYLITSGTPNNCQEFEFPLFAMIQYIFYNVLINSFVPLHQFRSRIHHPKQILQWRLTRPGMFHVNCQINLSFSGRFRRRAIFPKRKSILNGLKRFFPSFLELCTIDMELLNNMLSHYARSLVFQEKSRKS